MQPSIDFFCSDFADLSLTESEHEWLRRECPYFTPSYLAYLSKYRFKPEQVHVKFFPIPSDGKYGNIEIEVSGPWIETILWEVPLMACLSETYFQSVVTDWNYDKQEGKSASLQNTNHLIWVFLRTRICESSSTPGSWMRVQ